MLEEEPLIVLIVMFPITKSSSARYAGDGTVVVMSRAVGKLAVDDRAEPGAGA